MKKDEAIRILEGWIENWKRIGEEGHTEAHKEICETRRDSYQMCAYLLDCIEEIKNGR